MEQHSNKNPITEKKPEFHLAGARPFDDLARPDAVRRLRALHQRPVDKSSPPCAIAKRPLSPMGCKPRDCLPLAPAK